MVRTIAGGMLVLALLIAGCHRGPDAPAGSGEGGVQSVTTGNATPRSPAPARPQAPTEQFYTFDDAPQDFFIDKINLIVPFERDGRTVVRARVYRCGEGGEPFVGRMERYTDRALHDLRTWEADPANQARPHPRLFELDEIDLLVRLPGHARFDRWIPQADVPMGVQEALRNVHCPDGSLAQELRPDQVSGRRR